MLGMGYVGTMRAYLTLDNSQYRQGLIEAAGTTGKMTEKMQQQFARMQSYHSRLGMGATVLTTMVAPMAMGARRIEKVYGDYQKTMDKIQVVARLTDAQMKSLDASMVNMGKNIGVRPTEMAEAGYVAAQSMFTKMEDIQLIAKKAADLTVASGWETTPEKAADNITRMLSAFGLPTTRLQEMNDLLLRTRDVGRFSMEELGDSAGKTAAVIAAAFPKNKFQTMKDMMILMASGTLGGVPHSIMSTGLRSIMNAIYRESRRPKSLLNKVAKGQGFADAASMADAQGPIGFLQTMSKATGGYLELITALGFKSREMMSVAALLRNSMKNTLEAQKMLENSEGSERKGLDQHTKSWKFLKNQLTAFKEAFMLSFGKILIEYLTKATKFLIFFFQKLETMPDVTKRFIVWAGVLLGISSSLKIISALIGIIGLRSQTFGLLGMSKTSAGKSSAVTNWSGIIPALMYNLTSSRGWAYSIGKKMKGFGESNSSFFGHKFGAKPAYTGKTFNPWDAAKYQALADMTGFTFGRGIIQGSHSKLFQIPPDMLKNRQFMGFANNSKYGHVKSEDMVRMYQQAHQNVRFDPVNGYGGGRTVTQAVNAEMKKLLAGMATTGAGAVGGAAAATGTKAVLSKLPSLFAMVAKIAGILYVVISVAVGWWSAISEGFMGFLDWLGQCITGLADFKVSTTTLYNVFISLAVAVETIVETIMAVIGILTGAMMSIGNIIPTLYRAISAFMDPGNKMEMGKDGRYHPVMEKNWYGKMVPVKNSRTDAFGQAMKEGLSESSSIMSGAWTDLKDSWGKISTSKLWDTGVQPVLEKGPLWGQQPKSKDNGEPPPERPTLPDSFTMTREYAGAYLYGSQEAWNARLPYYMSKDETIALQKQQVDIASNSRDYLKDIADAMKSNTTETASGDDFEGADLGE